MVGLLVVLGVLLLLALPGGIEVAPLWEEARGVIAAIAGDPAYRAVAIWGVLLTYMIWRASR